MLCTDTKDTPRPPPPSLNSIFTFIIKNILIFFKIHTCTSVLTSLLMSILINILVNILERALVSVLVNRFVNKNQKNKLYNIFL